MNAVYVFNKYKFLSKKEALNISKKPNKTFSIQNNKQL